LIQDGKTYPPSKYIKDFLDERNWTQADLAMILGWLPTDVSSLIRRKKKLTAEVAQQLADAFNTTPEFWMEIEGNYWTNVESRIALLEVAPNEIIRKRSDLFSNFPTKEMQKRGWISETDRIEELEPELARFFEDNEFESQVAFKRTIKELSLNSAERAWVYRAKHLAKILPAADYDADILDKLLEQLRKFAAKSKAVIRVPELLSNYGIRFVIVEHLPKAKIDGAAFWLNDNAPVIAMSMRFDNIGSFWFTLMHELSHIKHRDTFSFDDLESNEPLSDTELRANEEAAESLIPKTRLESFIKMYSPYYTEAKINNLATQLNIHPGVIVGQLQHRKEIGFNAHRKIMAQVRELITTTAFTDGWGHPVPQVRY
jgi:HTH-type transcriptional regulator/antitoxin HigA